MAHVHKGPSHVVRSLLTSVVYELSVAIFCQSWGFRVIEGIFVYIAWNTTGHPTHLLFVADIQSPLPNYGLLGIVSVVL